MHELPSRELLSHQKISQRLHGEGRLLLSDGAQEDPLPGAGRKPTIGCIETDGEVLTHPVTDSPDLL